jgi:hypothetical protein
VAKAGENDEAVSRCSFFLSSPFPGLDPVNAVQRVAIPSFVNIFVAGSTRSAMQVLPGFVDGRDASKSARPFRRIRGAGISQAPACGGWW